MLLRKVVINPVVIRRHLALFSRRQPIALQSIRSKWVSGADARATSNVPTGTTLGHPEDPELHTYDGEYRGSPDKGDTLIPDYVYRSPPPGTTFIDRSITTLITGVLWFWFTYHMYYHSGHILGHWYMPYTSEFSDEELGIPPDNSADPAYWGNHGKPHGTYR